MESGRAKGFNLAEASTLISQAEQAFSTGDYAKARELAKQAKAIAEKATEVENIINEVRSVLSQEKSKGFYSAEAESLLSQAEHAFKAGNYEEAKSLAENVTALALDIDQDGVANEEDFAPTIKNIYIYAAIPIVILLFIGAVKAGVMVKEKAKEKIEIKRREKLERERIRREEERRRLEYERELNEIKAKYEQLKSEGYKPDDDLEKMLK